MLIADPTIESESTTGAVHSPQNHKVVLKERPSRWWRCQAQRELGLQPLKRRCVGCHENAQAEAKDGSGQPARAQTRPAPPK